MSKKIEKYVRRDTKGQVEAIHQSSFLNLHDFVEKAGFTEEVPPYPSISQRWDLMVEWLGVEQNKAKMEQILNESWPEGVEFNDPKMKSFSTISHSGRDENPIVVAAIKEIMQGKKWKEVVRAYPHLKLEQIFLDGEYHKEIISDLVDKVKTPINPEIILEGFLMTPVYVRSTFDAKLELAMNRSYGYAESRRYEIALEKAFEEGDVRVAKRIFDLFPEMIIPSNVAELVRIEMSNSSGDSVPQISEETRHKLATIKLEYSNFEKPEDQAKYYSDRMSIVKAYLMAGMSEEAVEFFEDSKFPNVEKDDPMSNVKYHEIMSLVRSVTILQDFPDYADKIKASLMQNIREFAIHYEGNKKANPVINHIDNIFLGILKEGHKELFLEMINEIPETLTTTPFWIGNFNRVIYDSIPRTKDKSVKRKYFEWVVDNGLEPKVTDTSYSFQKDLWEEWNRDGQWDHILSKFGYTSDILLTTTYDQIISSNAEGGKLSQMLNEIGINNDHDLTLLKLDNTPVEFYFEAKEKLYS